MKPPRKSYFSPKLCSSSTLHIEIQMHIKLYQNLARSWWGTCQGGVERKGALGGVGKCSLNIHWSVVFSLC